MQKQLLSTLTILFSIVFLTCNSLSASSESDKVQMTNELPSVAITINSITPTSIDAQFTPNAECDSFWILQMTEDELELWTSMMQMNVSDLIFMWGAACTGVTNHVWDECTPNTNYILYVLAKGLDHTTFTYDSILCTTPSMGGSGEAIVTIQLSEITTNSVRMLCVPNEETMVYHDGLIEVETYNLLGADSAVNIIKNNGYPLYDDDDWIWQNLNSNTNFYAIAVAKNGDNQWGTTTIVPFSTLNTVGITDNNDNQSFKLYPNPCQTEFTIDLGNNSSTGILSIYNLLGSKVYEEKITNSIQKIDVQLLTPDTYLIVLSPKMGTITTVKKLIITD